VLTHSLTVVENTQRRRNSLSSQPESRRDVTKYGRRGSRGERRMGIIVYTKARGVSEYYDNKRRPN